MIAELFDQLPAVTVKGIEALRLFGFVPEPLTDDEQTVAVDGVVAVVTPEGDAGGGLLTLLGDAGWCASFRVNDVKVWHIT